MKKIDIHAHTIAFPEFFPTEIYNFVTPEAIIELLFTIVLFFVIIYSKE